MPLDEFFDAGTLNPGTSTAKELSFYRTVHGPVIGYASVHGRLVALSTKRASYGKDTLDLLFYHDLAHGLVHNVHQFFKAAAQTPQTFNSFYVDDKDIGVFTSGLIPKRPSNVDPALPIDGRGKEEWHGYVSFKNHPQGINPPNGEIVNWNNRPEAGYEAPDDNWSLGAVQRVDLLINNLGHGNNLTPASLVSAMNAAATQDVREMTFEPVLSQLLHSGPAPNARDKEMLALLDAWHQHGGSRLDRTDASGIGNDHRSGRGGDGHRLAAARQRVGIERARADAHQTVRLVREPVRPAAEWAVHRLAHLHGQGPAHDPRRQGPG